MALTDWMKQYANIKLGELHMPGSHDAGTSEGYIDLTMAGSVSNSATQTLTIPQQIAAGTRFFDLRLAVHEKKVVAHHTTGGQGAYSKTTEQRKSAPGSVIKQSVSVVVDSAVRDEGTSFHYLAAGRTVDADPDGVAALVDRLHAADVAHTVGRTWTTDAVYRETRGRTDRRRDEGCLTVEMEAAALIAVARFRRASFSQVLFAGDSLAGEEWDHRRWTTARDARRALAEVVLGVSPP